MTITLEERLQRAAQVLDREAVDVHLEITPQPHHEPPEPRSFAIQLVTACLVVVGLVGTAWALTRSPSSSPVGSTPGSATATTTVTELNNPAVTVGPPTTAAVLITAPTTAVPPLATLPVTADVSAAVPVTIVGSGPSEWYRLTPDLDVAWYSDGSGASSMLCFRTPAGSECQVDRFDGPLAVHSVGSQVLVVTREQTPEVAVAFANGEVLTAPVERDPQIGWGVARLEAPDSSTPVGMSMLFEIAVPATTMPVPATTVPANLPAAGPDVTVASPTPTTPDATAPPDTAPPTSAAN